MLFFLTGRPDLVRKAARSCAEDLLLPALPAPEKGSARTESLTSDAIVLENTEPDFLTLPPGQTCILDGPEEPEEALTSSEELSGRTAAPENPAIPRFVIRSERDFLKVSAWIWKQGFHLRDYREADLEEIGELFRNSIRNLCQKDYSPAQRQAWISGFDPEKWSRTLREHQTVVAEFGQRIVGFADLDGNLLDRLYVHGHFTRRGVGRALTERILELARQSGETSLRTETSLTARPFFERMGFCVRKEQQVERKGILLTNFVMETVL